jgi:hypothetical protein
LFFPNGGKRGAKGLVPMPEASIHWLMASRALECTGTS